MRLYLILGTAFQSLIPKVAQYNAISLIVEIAKCSHSVDVEVKRFLLMPLFCISLLTFLFTILYPLLVLISLFVKSPHDTFYPLPAHTARVLACADFKLLSRYVERYAINYYSKFIWHHQPTFITLSLIKLIFQDIIVLIILIIFMFYILENSLGIFMMTVICFTGLSIINSLLTIYFKQTSQLDHDCFMEIKRFIFEKNDDVPNSDLSFHESKSRTDYGKFCYLCLFNLYDCR